MTGQLAAFRLVQCGPRSGSCWAKRHRLLRQERAPPLDHESSCEVGSSTLRRGRLLPCTYRLDDTALSRKDLVRSRNGSADVTVV